LADAAITQQLAEGAGDLGGLDQVVLRAVGVAIVFHHAGEHYLRSAHPVEVGKIVLLEGLHDLEHAVAAEVERDDRRAVFDAADRLAVLGDDEGGQLLVDHARGLAPKCLERLHGRGKRAPVAEDVCFPATLDDGPVGLVAVHGGDHAAAAGGDAVAPIRPGVDGAQVLFELLQVGVGAGLRNIASVEQRVDVELTHAVAVGAADHGEQVIDVRVNIPIGEQPEQVQRLAVGDAAAGHLLPHLAREQATVVDGLGHQFGALIEDASRAESVVANLTVTHVIGGGHADRQSVGGEARGDGLGGDAVEVRGLGECYCVRLVPAADADPVHDDYHYRAGDPLWSIAQLWTRHVDLRMGSMWVGAWAQLGRWAGSRGSVKGVDRGSAVPWLPGWAFASGRSAWPRRWRCVAAPSRGRAPAPGRRVPR